MSRDISAFESPAVSSARDIITSVSHCQLPDVSGACGRCDIDSNVERVVVPRGGVGEAKGIEWVGNSEEALVIPRRAAGGNRIAAGGTICTTAQIQRPVIRSILASFKA